MRSILVLPTNFCNPGTYFPNFIVLSKIYSRLPKNFCNPGTYLPNFIVHKLVYYLVPSKGIFYVQIRALAQGLGPKASGKAFTPVKVWP